MSARSSSLVGRTLKTATSFAIVTALGLFAGGAANSQPPALKDQPKATRPAAPVASAKPDAQGFIPQFSILEIMESIVMPSAQTIWDSVAVDVTDKGTIEKGPVTDEDWAKLRWTAVTLAESTNLLIVPGRRVAPPGTKSENPDSELSTRGDAGADREEPSGVRRARARAARGRHGGPARDRRAQARRDLRRRRHDRRRVRGLPLAILVPEPAAAARAEEVGHIAAARASGPIAAAGRRLLLCATIPISKRPVSTSTLERHDHASTTAFSILAAISFCHLLNDMMQSLLPSIYPILKANYALDFGQIGLITFTFQFTASLLQPVIGYLTDRWPQPYSLVVGMGFSLIGLLLLASAASYPGLLIAAALVGSGSAVLHPESSRVARMAAGSQPGLAQAVFQLGGNLGSSLGPLFAAGIVLRNGQSSVAWFGIAARDRDDRARARRALVQGARARANAVARRSQRRRGAAAARQGRVLGRGARRADLLEVLLHGEHVELLHVLSDRPIRRAGADGADHAVRVSGARLRSAP